jgi:RND family efflux transporter MFP subunit
MDTVSFMLRFIVTPVLVAIAGFVAWQLWIYYMQDPWTRDGQMRADTVELAPDVSGPVVQVFVHDNDVVHAGEPLFQIDPARFTIAIQQAQAAVMKTRAAIQDAQRTAQRYAAHSVNAVSGQSRDETRSVAIEAAAEYNEAQADAAVAALNLQHSTVRATVNGTVTNFSMRPGDYTSTGTPMVVSVDSNSLYVDGYFEETKLRRISLGDPAQVTPLDGGPPITWHVAGIAAGITNADRKASPTLLADVNPTFTWVRLPQRVPVRIALDAVPAGPELVAGMTCTVDIGHQSP